MNTMNDLATPAPTKPSRKRRASTPRAPRFKDPGILAIEAEAAKKKAEYRKAQQSGGVLKRIDKLLPKLTQTHLDALLAVLNARATPPLPLEPVPPSKIGGQE